MQDVSLAKIGGKGLFVKEIEDSLLRGEIDLAVHSMKDVPVELPDGLVIALTPKREDPRDAFISSDGRTIDAMPQGAHIGTGSLRRGVQIKNRMPQLDIVPIRGNLDTRIRKVTDNTLDGVIVAAAGMKRMGWTERISQYLPAEILLPAACQGILGIETRQDDPLIRELQFLRDEQTWVEMTAERAFLKRLGGGCQLPVAVYGNLKGKTLRIDALVGSLDGKMMVRRKLTGNAADAAQLGNTLAETILTDGGKEILDAVYAAS